MSGINISPVPKSQLLYKLVRKTYREKQCKSNLKYNWLVSIFLILATISNCGKLLRDLNTTFNKKLLKGTQLIAGSNGKKFRYWTIRSQAPKFVINHMAIAA